MTKRKIAFFIVTLLVIYVILIYRNVLIDIISPFLIAFVVAYLLNPLVIFFQNKGIKRGFSVILVFLIFVSLISFFCIFFIPKIIKDVYILVEDIPTYSKELTDYLLNLEIKMLNSNMPDSIKQVFYNNISIVEKLLISILQKSINIIIYILSNSIEIALIPVITFYYLIDSSYFMNQAILVIPKKNRQRMLQLVRDIDGVVGKFIRGQIIVCLLIAVLTSAVLFILNVRYAVILGIFAGITNVIPYFGPIISAVPITVFALMDSINKAIYVLAAFIVIQQLEGDIITPKIIGESVGIHPVYVILSLVIGAKFLGIIGMIIALPVVASLKLIIRYFIRGIK